MNLKLSFAAAALAASLCAAPALAATPVFSTDFEGAPSVAGGVGVSGAAAGGTIMSSEALPGFGTTYFHNSTSGLSYITLSGLGAHASLNLSFDLAFIDTWDGNDVAICCQPDLLFVTRDGAPLLTLSSNNTQGINPQYQGGTVVADGDYAWSGGFHDIIVHYDLAFNHTGSSFTLGFQAGGAGWQGDGNDFDESWGIDNVSLSASDLSVTPEPAAWAMMLLGFGGLGAMIRRRRAIAV